MRNHTQNTFKEEKKMTRFISIRNEQVAELVSRTDEQVVLKMEDGKEKSISPATLKRWWKEIEEPQTEEITSTDEVVAEAEITLTEAEMEEKKMTRFASYWTDINSNMIDPMIEEGPIAKVEKKAKKPAKKKTIDNPHPLKKLQRKLRREQRQLSRKIPKSMNRERARVRVARIHERIANIRRDFLHKISTRLARENQTVAVEHLNIKGMLRNHKLAKSISDVSWSEFFRQLSYKTERHGGELLKVDTFYPSSQTCSVCGYQNPLTEDLSVREWDCPACGTHHDRDVNAAKNILRKALEDKYQVA